MITHGTLKDINAPFHSRKAVISVEVTASPEEIEKYKDMPLDIKITKHRNKRSLSANAMLWACLGDMAQATGIDAYTLYLTKLKEYGVFQYVEVMPNLVEAWKLQWKDCEVVGETESGNIEMICYFGSSTYNTKEFSKLLDGVVSDMKDLGLSIPPREDMQKAIDSITGASNRNEKSSKA